MRGAIHPLPQYAFMAWCSVKNSTGTTLIYGISRFLVFIKTTYYTLSSAGLTKFTPSQPISLRSLSRYEETVKIFGRKFHSHLSTLHDTVPYTRPVVCLYHGVTAKRQKRSRSVITDIN
jgi:hypothetical protein